MKRAMFNFFASFFLVFFMLTGQSEASQQIRIFTNPCISSAVKEIARIFEKNTGCKVIVSSGPHFIMSKHIKMGHPFPVYITKYKKNIEEMKKENFKILSQKVIARNSMVLVKAENNSKEFRIENDSQVKKILFDEKMSIPNPDKWLLGLSAKEVLQSMGLWEILKENIMITKTAKINVAMLKRGVTDISIIYKTIGIEAGLNIIYEIPESYHKKILYHTVLVQSEENKFGKALYYFLSSEESKKILRNRGFILEQ